SVLSESEIITEIERYLPCRFVVLTGGEPSLQITEEFIDSLISRGYFVAIETNGTLPLPKNISWVTCSPKFEFCENAEVRLNHIDELKVIFCGNNQAIDEYSAIPARYRHLQPCDTGAPARNRQLMTDAISYVKAHPEWRLSIQLHKILNIP
ncbi:MAG: 7-carboxy-7-deazaguanine synthase QueE, partial [Roseburia sp.]|nr:7-carboxy-7-deazaguanine synthase QueE [Roseburia sp.]